MTGDLRRWRLSSVFVGSIFQIFPPTVNQRSETVTLFPLGLVYLHLFFVKFPFTIYFDYFTFVYFWSERIDVFGKFLLRFHIQFTLMEIDSDLACNRCNIVSSHKCLTYTNQTFCSTRFNIKLIKFFGGEYFETERPCLFYFCVDIARILKLTRYKGSGCARPIYSREPP